MTEKSQRQEAHEPVTVTRGKLEVAASCDPTARSGRSELPPRLPERPPIAASQLPRILAIFPVGICLAYGGAACARARG